MRKGKDLYLGKVILYPTGIKYNQQQSKADNFLINPLFKLM